MKHNDSSHVRDLLERLSRLHASEDWSGDINPSQRAALAYLAKANRFSRAPSQVAQYLGATRGTVSQTLKALARKELIEEVRSQSDKRSISYDVTKAGFATLDFSTAIDAALADMNIGDRQQLTKSLGSLLTGLLQKRGDRSFGICSTCRHNIKSDTGTWCGLLELSLTPVDTKQICHEHTGS